MQRTMSFAAAAALLGLAPITPLQAQDYRLSGFDGPVGTNATLNLRLPLGGRAASQRPRLGLTIGYGRMVGAPAVGASPVVRQFRLADLGFGRRGLRRAEVASFDLLNLDRDRRLGFLGDSDGDDTMKYLLVGVLGIAAGVGAEMLLDDSSEEPEGAPDDPVSPGLG